MKRPGWLVLFVTLVVALSLSSCDAPLTFFLQELSEARGHTGGTGDGSPLPGSQIFLQILDLPLGEYRSEIIAVIDGEAIPLTEIK